MCAGKSRLVVGLLVCIFSLGACGCGKKAIPAQMPLDEAIDQGVVQINAHGIDLEKVSVSISCAHKTTIRIPAGTLFVSGIGDCQNMMTATSVTIDFPGSTEGTGASHTETRELEVYCVNRWLDVPEKATSFTVSKPDRKDPRAKLSACLEGTTTDHGLRQFAMWLVSDNIWDMTVAEFVEREKKESQDKLVKKLRAEQPNIPSVDLEELVRQMLREAPEMKELMGDRLAMRDRVRPLLEKCGFDVSQKEFFRK